jgi:hypothetical protein
MGRIRIDILGIIAGIILVAPPLLAESEEPTGQQLQTPSIPMTAAQRVDKPEKLSVGDTFQIIVDLQYPGQYDILPERISNEHAVELKHIRREKTDISEDKTETRLTFVYQVFAPGRHRLPPIPINMEDSEETKTLQTTEQFVDVLSTVDSAQNLSLSTHIEPVSVTRFSQRRLWVAIGGASLLALLLAVAWRRRSDIVSQTEDIDPYDRAVSRLNELESAGHIESGEFDIFFLKTSHIVRELLENYYDFPACEMTTSEIRRQIKRVSLPDDLGNRDLYNWLVESDYYKFSGSDPGVETARDHLDKAFDLVKYFEPEADEED